MDPCLKIHNQVDPGFKMHKIKQRDRNQTLTSARGTRRYKEGGENQNSLGSYLLYALCFTYTISKISLAIFTDYLLYALGLVIWS